MSVKRIHGTLEERFWPKVSIAGADECWEWQAARDDFGYGRFGRRSLRAHRMSYAMAHGEIPDGLCVLHRCDNPPCVNPAHLFLGTRQDNAADMNKKRRHWVYSGKVVVPRGERHPKTTLTTRQVKAIRRRYANGETQVALAAKFGVTQQSVSDIVRRRVWTHV